MGLSDIATITLTTESASATREGFGMPLILASDAPGGFTERVRFYSTLSELAVDFASTTATYKQAAKIFAQQTRPPTVAVGRLANVPTQRFALTPTASNSTVYSGVVDGAAWSYTSDASATVAEIIAGVKAAIDALGKAVTTSDQTTYLRVLANAAGAFHEVYVDDTSRMAIAQDHADPGAATDLDAILLEDSSWYCILNPFNSSAMAAAIAGWAESNKKFFVCQTVDSAVANTTSGSDTTSIAYVIRADFRTALIYHPTNSDFADAAWAGRVLPLDPGSETWAFKTLAGVGSAVLTSTKQTNLKNKHVNFYVTIGGLGRTQQGKVVANEWIDVIRFRDWLEINMQTDILEALANSKKIPFTDAGIAILEGKIRARLKAGVAVGALASDPAPRVSVPLAADVSASDKAARTLTGVTFDAVLAGAIHAITINGSLSV